MASNSTMRTASFILIVAIAFFAASAQEAAATTNKVTVKFTVDGFTNYTSNIITIDGATYSVSDLSWRTFEWSIGSTHIITAYSSIKNTEYPSRNYTFATWSNGNGLTTNSGIFTVPNCDITVTANYVLATHITTFAVTGLTSYSGNILTIDGVTYTVSDLGWKAFAWDVGTTHTIAAVTPIHNTDIPKLE
jgi:hypothetical protein